MSDSAARAQRAAALEEKRRRLEELKKRRSRRDEDTAKVKAAASANLDEYIDGLLSQQLPVTAATNDAASTLNDNNISSTAAVGGDGATPTTGAHASSSSLPVDASAEDKSKEAAVTAVAESKPAPPKKVVETFAIGTQTEPEHLEDAAASPDDAVDQLEKKDANKQEKSANEEDDTLQEDLSKKDPKILSVPEIEKEISSAPFSSFITTASKKVERMLGTPLLADLLVDYVGETDGSEQRRADEAKDVAGTASRFVSSRQVYECPVWTEGRDITDIDWSPLHRELVLSTYHMVTSSASAPLQSVAKGSSAVSAISPNDTMSSSLTPANRGELQSDGLALVWSLAMPTRPEHIFTCGSPVTTGRFHPTESPLVIGGCESGQMVVWDVRAGRLPVQKSSLTTVVGASTKGHMYPIVSMEVVESGAGLVTASMDGKVNFWSFGNLRDPVETIQVGESVSCFAVAPESESLLLGDENGVLSAVSSGSQSTSGQRSSRRQVRKLEQAEGGNLGHFGMITSLSAKKALKSGSAATAGMAKGFLRGSGGLVLSSGVDWTVKLWAPAYSDSPLLSLVSHSYDYMSDVQWCPSHPSLFATASSNGTVGLWDFAISLDEPLTGVDGIVIEPDAMSSGRGLNKIKWSHGSTASASGAGSGGGRRMAVASSDRLHILTLAEQVLRSKGDEDAKIMNQLLARGLIGRQ